MQVSRPLEKRSPVVMGRVERPTVRRGQAPWFRVGLALCFTAVLCAEPEQAARTEKPAVAVEVNSVWGQWRLEDVGGPLDLRFEPPREDLRAEMGGWVSGPRLRAAPFQRSVSSGGGVEVEFLQIGQDGAHAYLLRVAPNGPGRLRGLLRVDRGPSREVLLLARVDPAGSWRVRVGKVTSPPIFARSRIGHGSRVGALGAAEREGQEGALVLLRQNGSWQGHFSVPGAAVLGLESLLVEERGLLLEFSGAFVVTARFQGSETLLGQWRTRDARFGGAWLAERVGARPAPGRLPNFPGPDGIWFGATDAAAGGLPLRFEFQGGHVHAVKLRVGGRPVRLEGVTFGATGFGCLAVHPFLGPKGRIVMAGAMGPGGSLEGTYATSTGDVGSWSARRGRRL